MIRRALPGRDILSLNLSYDPATGELTRRRWGRTFRVGAADASGYLSFRFGRRKCYVHRVAWVLSFGEEPETIDHINGDRADNRLSNLRAASFSENSQNQRRVGIKGLDRLPSGRWRVSIRARGKRIRARGTYATKEEAGAAYDALALEHHGAFAQLNAKSHAGSASVLPPLLALSWRGL